MKIKINDFWLCETGQLAPDTFRINGRRETQIAQRIRAAAAAVFNRYNTVTTISFSVVREHTTILAAEAYLMQHEVDIPQSGIVTIICYNDAGAESAYYFDCGGLETTEASYVGCSTQHSYTLVCGRITTEKPT